jgi:hypothetical protein
VERVELTSSSLRTLEMGYAHAYPWAKAMDKIQVKTKACLQLNGMEYIKRKQK